MDLYRLSMALTIGGTVGYHVCNKSIAPMVPPAISLVASYFVALAASCALALIDPGAGGLAAGARQLNWASFALGASIVAVEAGFVVAYRVGWTISTAALYSIVGTSLLLIPIGLSLYRERLPAANVVGVIFAIAGIVLMSRR